MSTLETFFERCRERIEGLLSERLPEPDREPRRLYEAMRYAVLGGGKRLRPILVYASGRAVGLPMETVDGPACAVELIHAYSLVHDDLPAMDNDDLRRGKPTCHRAFDEATAILVGDGLQALAFELLASDQNLPVSPARRLEMVALLARAAGPEGMVGGQALDLAATGKALSLAQLQRLHAMKTGALIRASVLLGAMAREPLSEEKLAALDRYARAVGLAFQIRDDILDIEAPTEQLGKTQGKDLAQKKATYPALLGLEGARREAERVVAEALAALEGFGEEADLLRQIALYIIQRRS